MIPIKQHGGAFGVDYGTEDYIRKPLWMYIKEKRYCFFFPRDGRSRHELPEHLSDIAKETLYRLTRRYRIRSLAKYNNLADKICARYCFTHSSTVNATHLYHYEHNIDKSDIVVATDDRDRYRCVYIDYRATDINVNLRKDREIKNEQARHREYMKVYRAARELKELRNSIKSLRTAVKQQHLKANI